MTTVIDTHLHIFVDAIDYPWLGSTPMPRGIAPYDELRHGGHAIVVEAGAASPVDELRAIQALAATAPWIRGFVAPLDLGAHDPDVDDLVVGFRAQVGAPVDIARAGGRALDLLLGDSGWAAALELLESHPEQPFVIDHCGGGELGSAGWRAFIAAAAQHPLAVVKISGAPPRAAIEVSLAAFGAHRAMFGSDWPVTVDPGGQLELLGASATEADQVLSATARRVYGV